MRRPNWLRRGFVGKSYVAPTPAGAGRGYVVPTPADPPANNAP